MEDETKEIPKQSNEDKIKELEIKIQSLEGQIQAYQQADIKLKNIILRMANQIYGDGNAVPK